MVKPATVYVTSILERVGEHLGLCNTVPILVILLAVGLLHAFSLRLYPKEWQCSTFEAVVQLYVAAAFVAKAVAIT